MPWTYFISDVNGEEIVGTFYEKKLHKTKQRDKIENVIKRKSDKLNVKQKGYDNSKNQIKRKQIKQNFERGR